MADRRKELEEAEARVQAVRQQYLGDIANALDALEQAHVNVYEAIVTARDIDISYREMREATGRSHEFFRAFETRWAKRVKPKKRA